MRPRPILAITFLISLLCLSVVSQTKSDDVIRVDTALVNIPVIVSDRDNRYIPGLTQQNFKVFQDGEEQKIEVFNNDNAPMNIVLALDTSLSTYSVLGKIKKAAKQFIKDLQTDDRCMIMSFDYEVHSLSELTSNKKDLESAINRAEIGQQAGTTLNDALYRAINGSLRAIKGRKAIILLTDGKDHGSYHSMREMLDGLNESDTVIYPVYYETDLDMRQIFRDRDNFPDPDIFGRFPRGGRRGGGMGRFPGGMGRGGNFPGQRRNRPNAEEENALAKRFLQQLADITGGRFFKEEKADLKDAFRQIADEMKRQYLIGFYPAGESPAGTVHSIRVKVDRSNAVVRSKGTYRTQNIK